MFGFSDKKVYVYGLGSSGRAVAKALMETGVKVVAWDDRAADEKELTLLPPDKVNWSEISAVVKSPGIAMTTPLIAAAKAHGVMVTSDLDLFARREAGQRMEVIGITGTNGKSTTTALIGHVLRASGRKVAVGGNIGNPALGLPELGDLGIYVLELSSYQLENLSELQVDGALFLNLTPDHLERHGDMENYRKIKLHLFELCVPGAVKVMGTDQAMMREVSEDMAVLRVNTTGGKGEVTVREGAVWLGEQKQFELEQFTHLPGPHNAQNIACAFALLVPRWVSVEQFVKATRTFKGLPHRIEAVGKLGNVRFINDSKATNGDSAVYALQSFKHIYWICGGLPKSDGLGACVEHLGAVRAAFTIGQSGEDFAKILEERGVAVFRSGTLEKAVGEAFSAARTEGFEDAVVLLSPAAASWDQFKSYEHRGDVFVNCVRQIVQEGQG